MAGSPLGAGSPIGILIAGTYPRQGLTAVQRKLYGNMTVTGRNRSHATMIVWVIPSSKRILLLSIPYDTFVPTYGTRGPKKAVTPSISVRKHWLKPSKAAHPRTDQCLNRSEFQGGDAAGAITGRDQGRLPLPIARHCVRFERWCRMPGPKRNSCPGACSKSVIPVLQMAAGCMTAGVVSVAFTGSTPLYAQ